MYKLRAIGQKRFQEVYPELNFVKIFGRNYIDEEEKEEKTDKLPSIDLGEDENGKH